MNENLSRPESEALLSALHRLSLGVLLLQPDAKIRYVNHAAAELLEQADGLAIRDGHLTATLPPTQESLDQTLTSIGTTGRIAFLAIDRLSGNVSIQLALLPSNDGELVTGIISDPFAELQGIPPVMTALFGLTKAEAQVVSLVVQGHDVRQVAAVRGVSTATVRHQLRSVFTKTGVSRQVDLVRLVLTGVVSICIPSAK